MADAQVASQMHLSTAIAALHYASPLGIIAYYVTARIVSACIPQPPSPKVKGRLVRRDVILWLMLGVVVEYLAEITLILVRMLVQKDHTPSQNETIFLITSSLVWGIQFLALVDTKIPVWYPYHVNWIIGSLMEVVLLALQNVAHRPEGIFDDLVLSMQVVRICTFILLPCSYLVLRSAGESSGNEDDDAECQPLLIGEVTVGVVATVEANGTGYGTTGDTAKKSTADTSSKKSKNKTQNSHSTDHDPADDVWLKKVREAEEKQAKRLEEGNWWAYARGFAVFFPFLFPVHDRHLQMRIGLVAACLLATNSLNVLVPRQLGVVTDALINGNARGAWIAVAVYAFLTFANSGACIGWLQFWLWQPVEQYSYNALNTAAYSHVMNLSCDFHESKEPSEIHQAVLQGKSITGLVDTICFQLVPMFVDLFLVFAFLYYLFGPYMALILAITTLFYLYTTAKLVRITQARRRDYILFYRKEWRSAHNSLTNWRVASYFNNVPYEYNRYATNVRDHLYYNRAYDFAIKVTVAAQGLIMAFGLLGACLLAASQVIQQERSPGDFVILLGYWAQLRGPLAFFSGMYKELSESFMDAERLLEFFETKPTVTDKKDAQDLQYSKGEVVFDKVGFSYDTRKPTLDGVTFKVDGGSTIALVGETGSGKSTILKLLNRFYDVNSGSIRIDDQDVKDVTLTSLRDKMGVVPQDPTLFNDTVFNNVRYARFSATEEEVHEACRSAVIHDKIMTFPDGYSSMVGNNGVKLSGGEQQRIAIARAILKQPHIILLDEATSAVDTETEQLIQAAFRALCSGRTTFIVAHRLSTVMRADRIMVVKDGTIVEDGSHSELLKLKGKYHKLWTSQFLPNPAKPGPTGIESSNSDLKSTSTANGKIVNDLDLETRQAEISKLEHDAEHGEATEAGGDEAESVIPAVDGPDDSPSHLPLVNESSPSQRHELESQSGDESINRDSTTQELSNGQSYLAGAKNLSANGDENSTEAAGVIDVRGETSVYGANPALPGRTISIKDDTLKGKRPRFRSRRRQPRSEPSSVVLETGDGAMDSEETAALSSGESQPLLGSSQRRRVSAPSDPWSSREAETGQSTTKRTRRSRLWKNRTRDAYRPGTGHAQGQSTNASSATLLNSASGSQGDFRSASGP